MVEWILALSVLLIVGGILLGLLRMIVGERTVDRVIALDLLTITAISLIGLAAHFADRVIYLDAAIVYGLLSFLGVLAVARYLEKGL